MINKPQKHIQEFQQLSYFIRRPSMITKLQQKGIQYFFPIQYETYDAINYGCDLIGKDRTGSGKTIAYSLPIIERLRDQLYTNLQISKPKLLIILPTRELAIQVKNQIESLRITPNQFKVLAVYGGSPVYAQLNALRQGIDIIVATPGRLIDLFDRNAIELTQLQCICLDEADQMLKQGFQEDVQKILQYVNRNTPIKTQKLLFSATIPTWVKELTTKFMSKERKMVDLIQNSQVKTSITIEHLCLSLSSINKRTVNETIRNIINIYAGQNGNIIIFTETKREANQLFNILDLNQAKALLHGDIEQFRRQITFRQFKEGRVKCLIATNVAARGLDIPLVDLVIQMEPPKKAEDYVHRSGRTGRAGKNGICILLCNPSCYFLVSSIQKMANIRFKHISEPKKTDLMKAKVNQIIHRIKNIDHGVAQYFQQSAKSLISQLGAEKALGLALAELSGIRTKIPEHSVQNNEEGFMTYIFSSEDEKTTPSELKQFLKNRLQKFSEKQLYRVSQISAKSIVFDIRQHFKKSINSVIAELQKSQNFLDKIYRLRHVTDEAILKNVQEQDDISYTKQEYENAFRNKEKLQVIVRGLQSNVDEIMIMKFFKNNNVRIINVHMPKDENGNHKGIGFVLCIDNQEKEKALLMSQQFSLQNRLLIIEVPYKRR